MVRHRLAAPILALAVSLLTSGLALAQTPPPAENPPVTPPAAPKPEKKDNAPAISRPDPKTIKRPVATIETPRGFIVLELYPDEAPRTVKNFIDLIKKGFYDGQFFHRVEPDFVIQAGDPLSKDLEPGNPSLGSGGPGYTIPDETNKKLKHDVGALGMAKSSLPDSGGSQFYIVLKKPASALDGRYTVFGKVISGLDIAESTQVGDHLLRVFVVEPEGQAAAAVEDNTPKVTQRAEPVAVFAPMYPFIEKPKPLKSMRVKVKVTIEADGKSKVQLKNSTGVREVDQAIKEAIEKWQWEPALKDGKKVKSDQTFTYDMTTNSRSYD